MLLIYGTPVLEKVFRGRKRTVGKSWRTVETYIKVKGQWSVYTVLPIKTATP